MLGNKYAPALSAPFASCELEHKGSVYGELLRTAAVIDRFNMIF